MPRRGGNTKALWASVVIGVAYLMLVDHLPTQAYSNLLRGSIGVILGLYICSHPAANVVNILFFNRGDLRQTSSRWSGLGWVVLNVSVVLLGWLVITSGMTRLVRPVD
jgi:uncharacterized membrane protein